MTLHLEAAFEDAICAHLAAHGWLHDPLPNPGYDRALALHQADLAAWVQATQPDAWTALEKAHGPAAAATLAKRVRECLDKHGTLPLLRDGAEVFGLKHTLALAQFRPALGLNGDLLARYAANRLRVLRQVRYSLHKEDSIDLVLLLNGIPVATAELKSDYTQSAEAAVEQYRADRPPKEPGRTPEPLLGFPGGALVHFAVSNRLVRMCTRLAGPDSVFLPFDRGDAGGAGNPADGGTPTRHLWEEIWARDSWLEILGRFVIPLRGAKKTLREWLFPRYHQLDAVRRLVAQVLADGPGGRYLVQHSAGSGKTKSIAWVAGFLADLHDAHHAKVFDTVLVVSDRDALDRNLREDLEAFERTPGVVATIKGDGGSKTTELSDALAAGKKIVLCTLQTFPHAVARIHELAATEGKRFAVIADEAHSSQSGATATKLKLALTPEEQADAADGGEVSVEDHLAAEMQARLSDSHAVSYVAFTATPKAKTLELFGRRPDPTLPASDANKPVAFHVYSMRQAIDEGFILDVLRHYTSYKLAFKLAHDGRDLSDAEVEAGEATKRIMGWVRLHPTNIAARVQIVVEHYRASVAHLLGGQAKAMVVTASRKEAVRWTLALRKYVADKNYQIRALVAFSGEVRDEESGPDPFTEAGMNPGANVNLLGKKDDEGQKPPYEILLVANKFQTGFDEPLLCALYVDRKLSGLQAVQTLSRLNRAAPKLGKDTTYVVDFVNEPEEVLAAFKQYHETAELGGVSDPNVVLDLRTKLEAYGYFDAADVHRVVKVSLNPKSTVGELDAALTPVSGKLLHAFKQAREEAAAGGKTAQDAKDRMEAMLRFRKDLNSYVGAYEFLGQMFDYANTDYEALYRFARLLRPLLRFERERDGVDLSALRLTHLRMRDLGQQTLNLGGGKATPLAPMTHVGEGQGHDKHKEQLARIIEALNDLFAGDLTDADKVAFFEAIRGKLLESSTLQAQAAANGVQQFRHSQQLVKSLKQAATSTLMAHQAMSAQVLNSPQAQAALIDALLGLGGLHEALAEAAGAPR